jgi:hypothetical protein
MPEADGKLKPLRVTGGRGAKPSRISGWVGAGGDEPRHNCQLPSKRPVAPARVRRTLVALRRRSRGPHARAETTAMASPQGDPNVIQYPGRPLGTLRPLRGTGFQRRETPQPPSLPRRGPNAKRRVWGWTSYFRGEKSPRRYFAPRRHSLSRGLRMPFRGNTNIGDPHLPAVANVLAVGVMRAARLALLVRALYVQIRVGRSSDDGRNQAEGRAQPDPGFRPRGRDVSPAEDAPDRSEPPRVPTPRDKLVQMGSRGVAGVLAVTTLWAIGCDGSSDCRNGCWQPTPADQSFIASVCALTATCCASNSFAQSSGVASSCTNGFGKSGLTADPSLQAACLSEMQTLAGSALCVPDVNDLSDPCLRAIREPSGPQQPGSQCMNRDDCAGAPGTIAACLAASSGVDVCIRVAPGKAGDHACLADLLANGLVFFGLRFDFQNGTQRVPSGVFCARSDGLYCAQTDDPTTSVCAPLVPDGGPCASANACASATCEPPGSASGTCAQTVTAGGSCAAYSDAVCDTASYCGSTTPSSVSSLVCMAKGSTGAPCTASEQCQSGVCDSNLCVARTASEVESLDSFCIGSVY